MSFETKLGGIAFTLTMQQVRVLPDNYGRAGRDHTSAKMLIETLEQKGFDTSNLPDELFEFAGMRKPVRGVSDEICGLIDAFEKAVEKATEAEENDDDDEELEAMRGNVREARINLLAAIHSALDEVQEKSDLTQAIVHSPEVLATASKQTPLPHWFKALIRKATIPAKDMWSIVWSEPALKITATYNRKVRKPIIWAILPQEDGTIVIAHDDNRIVLNPRDKVGYLRVPLKKQSTEIIERDSVIPVWFDDLLSDRLMDDDREDDYSFDRGETADTLWVMKRPSTGMFHETFTWRIVPSPDWLTVTLERMSDSLEGEDHTEADTVQVHHGSDPDKVAEALINRCPWKPEPKAAPRREQL